MAPGICACWYSLLNPTCRMVGGAAFSSLASWAGWTRADAGMMSVAAVAGSAATSTNSSGAISNNEDHRIMLTSIPLNQPILEWRNATPPSVGEGREYDGLVAVTLKPWCPVLPVGQPAIVIAHRHLDLRQTLSVEDFVLRDHLVHEKQIGRQRIDLIGRESPLPPERHAAMDIIPHRRRIRRGQWQYHPSG